MTLYEISAEYMALIDPDTGEVADFERLAEMSAAMEQKKENVALYIKNLTAEADALKTEKDALAEREKVKRAQVDRLSDYLSRFLAGEAYETAKVKCSFRKSTVCMVEDEVAFLKRYPKYKKIQTKLSLQDVKDALKTGVTLKGASLVDKYNLQVR
jgi:predicted aconitase